jgi:DNA-binding Xre family transcriptional regulator
MWDISSILAQNFDTGYIQHDISHKLLKSLWDISRREGCRLTVKEAIANRILQLCKERTIAPNELGNIAGINPSTIYSILGPKSKSPEVATIKKLCDALEITLGEFFSTPEFDGLEQEIR